MSSEVIDDPKLRDIKRLLDREAKLEALRAKYQPHAKQQLILDAIKSGVKYIFVRAGRQSGKTQESADISWLVAGLNPGSVCSIITPERKQAKKIYWKKRTIQDFGPSDWVRKEDNEDMTLFFHNGSYIELDGSDNIDSHRGDKKDLVILDEFKDINPRFFTEVIEPMFVTTGGIVVIIGTPPETPESHFRDLEEFALQDPAWAVVHWTSYDSPYSNNEWLDKKREELRNRGEEDSFIREYLAEYTIGGKNSVFPMVTQEDHMRSAGVVDRYYEANKQRAELYWISDPATSTTFGSLFIAYFRDTGKILVLDEIYETDKLKMHTGAIFGRAKEIMSRYEEDLSKWHMPYDDQAVWFANEMMHQFNIAIQPAKKQSVEKEDGISLMKSLFLQKNTVVISSLAHHFFSELQNYIMVNGKYVKKNDHLLDCFRYFQTFAHVVLSLAEGGEIIDDNDGYFDFVLPQQYSNTGLPSWIQ